MEWTHKCDLDWLKERQRFITASDIKKLLPVTATGRKRDVSDLDRLKVMSSKMVTLTEDDCWSYGAAARGHLLEPYAVDSLNKVLEKIGETERFYWWDDKLVTLPDRKLAFSPDAMNVPMTDDDVIEHVSAIAEIKSYSAEKHLTLAYTPKDRIEERWQIASTMALLDNIDHAYLVLFNPKMKKRKTFVIRFDRDELSEEIKVIKKVEEEWENFLLTGPLTTHPSSGAIWSACGGTEENIMKEISRKQNLNPHV